MMDIEDAVREAMSVIADDTPFAPALATAALRRARRRQYATRTALAGTAAAVAVPVGMGVLTVSGTGTSISPATSDPAAPQPSASSGPLSPPARELDAAEFATAFQASWQAVEGDGYDGWEPIFGVTIDTDVDPGVPTTWGVAQRGDDFRADCALDSTGQQVSGGGVYGAKSTPDLLYALVDAQEGGGNAGRYVDPIARVTVQHEDGLEEDAALWGGFWFFPLNPADSGHGDGPTVPSESTSDLIGIPAGYTIRGYDSGGALVYDSTTDGPTVDDCYADPTGNEFVGNWAGRTDPSECVLTHQWRPLGPLADVPPATD